MPDFTYERLEKGPVCGVDEAGCGPLAGDVYAAAVILNEEIEGLDDSKKLTEAKRERIYDEIIKRADAFAIGTASVEEIDSINILKAAQLAMKRAVSALSIRPATALVDGNKRPDLGEGIKVVPIIAGDSKSFSIAAASVLAKVARDRYMSALAKNYPEYFFEQHKGYPTKRHYEMLEKYGPIDIHRKTFLRKLREKVHG